MQLVLIFAGIVSSVSSHLDSVKRLDVAVVQLKDDFENVFGVGGHDRLCTTWKTILSDGGMPLDVFSVDKSTIVIGSGTGDIDRSVLQFVFRNPNIVSKYVFPR